MNLTDLFNKKISNIVKAQVKCWYPGITVSEINTLFETIRLDKNWFKIKEIRSYVYSSKSLSNIKDLCFYLDCAIGVPHTELGVFKAEQLYFLLKSDPENTLLTYFWIHRYLLDMPDEKVYEELPFFLGEIFDRYPDLIALDDFLENSITLKLNEDEIKKSPKLYKHLFDKASAKYPEKKSFIYYQAISHIFVGGLQFAFETVLELHHWMLDKFEDYLAENIEDNFYFYHYSNLVLEVIKSLDELSKFDEVIKIADMVQQVYFEKFKAGPDQFIYIDFFIELFFKKMMALYRLKKTNEIKEEFIKIQPYIEDDGINSYKAEYKELYKILHSEDMIN